MNDKFAPGVEARYENWPVDVRQKLLWLRQQIFDVARNTENVGAIEETLKWDVPSYVPVKPKTGTAIRLSAGKEKNQYGLYVHCQTSLIDGFREMYPDAFRYEKNRAIIFELDDRIAEDELRHCISMALTYHL